MKNKTARDVSHAVAQLMPHIIRGVQFDFFIRRGVTQTQFLLMTSIRVYNRCPMGTLARNLHVSMPTVTGVVGRLVDAGYVRRVPTPDDRRQVLVELTPKGQLFMQQFQAVIRQRWEEVLRSLHSEELAAFYHVIEKLRAQLEPSSRT